MYEHRGMVPATCASAIVLAIALAGCAPSAGAGGTAPAPIAATTTNPSTPGRDEAHSDEEEEDHPSVPVPEAAPVSQTDASSAAVIAVTAFARPVLSEQQWWNELLPLLSQKGAIAYEGTLPSNIPVTAITGQPTILPASTDVATLVEVPTDNGPYVVTLVRAAATEPWLAERIRPVGE